MPNRILKESICTSDSVDSLSWFEEVLFYRLIVNCDDYGRFDGRAAIIKNRLFPLKENLTAKTVSGAIEKLARTGLVTLYEFEGKPYLYLPGWNHHQNVRAKKSKYPEPVNICIQMNADESRLSLIQEDENRSNQENANVPVIQSNTKSESESISESESLSESNTGEVVRDKGASHEQSGEPKECIGLSPKKENDFLKSEQKPTGGADPGGPIRPDGKLAFGIRQNVFLTQKEYDWLESNFGESNLGLAITFLGAGMEKLTEEDKEKSHFELIRRRLWKKPYFRDGEP